MSTDVQCPGNGACSNQVPVIIHLEPVFVILDTKEICVKVNPFFSSQI